jgi:inward rectifier potassium channel
LSKLRGKRSERKPQLVRLGHREIETLGLSPGFWSDLYHRSMTVYWPVFFGSAAALFVALNAVFGFLYSLGHEPIANAAENGPLAYFYFSIETLATVGYGDMHPQSNYGHLIATIEIFTGMSFLAVLAPARNRESSALQYAMRDRLIALGWSEIEVIDDDLGRSAAGGVQRAGFERI